MRFVKKMLLAKFILATALLFFIACSGEPDTDMYVDLARYSNGEYSNQTPKPTPDFPEEPPEEPEVNSPMPEATPELVLEETTQPAQEPPEAPAPSKTPEPPVSTLAPTLSYKPTPSPEPTPEPIADTFSFPFPFSAEDLHGNPVTAATLGEREIFFVYFWTTWCFSCVESMPVLAELADMYGDRVGFITLLGDFDTAQDAAIRITEEAGAPFITANALHSDFQPLMELLNSGFVPTSVIIGRDGNVIGGQIVGGGAERFLVAIHDALD